MNKKELKKMALLFKSMTSERKLTVLEEVLKNDFTYTREISQNTGIPESPVAICLRELKNADLMEMDRDGNIVYYFIPEGKKNLVKKLIETAREIINWDWEEK